MSRLFGRMHETEVGDQVAEAVERLSRSGIGAIIAIEREVSLDEYVQSGSEMQAKVSRGPAGDDLHAVLSAARRRGHHSRRHDRRRGVHPAARRRRRSIDRSLGTRHRAALGLSEETDALVVVVSEETAAITVAVERPPAGATSRPRRCAISSPAVRFAR